MITRKQINSLQELRQETLQLKVLVQQQKVNIKLLLLQSPSEIVSLALTQTTPKFMAGSVTDKIIGGIKKLVQLVTQKSFKHQQQKAEEQKFLMESFNKTSFISSALQAYKLFRTIK